jgi:hypothetical protein
MYLLPQDRAFNDRRYYIGNSKLHSLGWQERTTWEEGLTKTIDWCVGCFVRLCFVAGTALHWSASLVLALTTAHHKGQLGNGCMLCVLCVASAWGCQARAPPGRRG